MADVLSSAAQRKARAARFKAEAKAGPPPLPVKRLAHPGGKIVTGNKEACLAALLARKQAAGEKLTDDQRRALSTLTNTPAPVSAPPPQQARVPEHERTSSMSAPPRAQIAEHVANTVVDNRSAAGKRIKTLRKKLHDIAELEQRAADGGVLQDNQKAKISTKAELIAELSQLEAGAA